MQEITSAVNLPDLDPSGRLVAAMVAEFQGCRKEFAARLQLRLTRTIEVQSGLEFHANEI